ncbi:MAG: shikimate dehydrogenase [Cyclobacteriaceae bacterium]|jgi:shikimate dehydrogenase
MRKFGLIGFPLGHSFSKKYFTEKFQNLGLTDHQYELFEMPDLGSFMELWNDSDLVGVNVTVPYKEKVMSFITRFDRSAEKVGAVNVIKKEADGLVGYNSDYYGFKLSLEKFIGMGSDIKRALILGTGGASKAVKAVLSDLNIEYKIISRTKSDNNYTYSELMENDSIVADANLIVNSTPLGTYPKVDTCPDLPYGVIGTHHFLYDLVYNPALTKFLSEGSKRGAVVKNGYDMLELQAERSWEIWNK